VTRLLAREVAWAVRRLLRRPFAAAIAVAAVAVAVAPSLLFQLVSRAVLPSLPFERPADLLSVSQRVPWRMPTSYPKLQYLAEHSRTMDVAAMAGGRLELEQEGGGRRLLGEAVTPSIFKILGTRPLLGRTFREDENDGPLDEPVAILGEHVWRETFGARDDILGQKIVLNQTVFSVVGVMPRGFATRWLQGRASLEDVWIPAMMAPVTKSAPGWRDTLRVLELPEAATWTGLARLRDGHSLSEARAEAEVLAEQVRRRWPWPEVDEDSGSRPFVLTRLSEDAIDPKVLDAVSLLRVAGVLVLILGGLNLASLFLARGLERSRATGLHAALGAPRLVLVGGILAEAVLVGALGGLGAIALARGALTLLGLLEPSILTAPFGVTFDPAAWRFDGWLFGGAMVVSVALGFTFSLGPALRSTRLGVAGFLHAGPGIVAGGLRRLSLRRPAGVLVAFEMAVALALVAPALLLARSLESLVSADLGFRPGPVVTAPLSLPAARYPEGAVAPFVDRAVGELAAIPGMEAASWVSCLPIGSAYFSHTVSRSGAPGHRLSATVHAVAPGAFDVLGMPIRRGRDFGADDRQEAPPVVILSQQGARELGVAEPGARIDVGPRSGLEVVGIVGDVPYGEVTGELLPAVYFPLAQMPMFDGVLIARSSEDPRSLAAPMARAVAALDPRLEKLAVSTLDNRVGQNVARFRGAAWLLGAAALLALLLSGVGVYGVLSSLVGRSIPEIGIRLALGASPGTIRRSITGTALRLAAAGTAVGVGLGTWGATYLRGYLYGVLPGDPLALLLSLAVAVALAVTAGLAPASRASRVDPIEVLRRE
jgi:putative ABC transport system permease protein